MKVGDEVWVYGKRDETRRVIVAERVIIVRQGQPGPGVTPGPGPSPTPGGTPAPGGETPLAQGKVTRLDAASSSFTIDVGSNRTETVVVQASTQFVIRLTGGSGPGPGVTPTPGPTPGVTPGRLTGPFDLAQTQPTPGPLPTPGPNPTPGPGGTPTPGGGQGDQPAKPGDLQTGDQVQVFGTRDSQQRILATRVVIVRQSQPGGQPGQPGPVTQRFQGRVLSVDAAKKSFQMQPDFGGPAIDVVVSDKTKYEGVTFEGIKKDGQVEVSGQRQGNRVQADGVRALEVPKTSVAGEVAFVDLSQRNIILKGPSYQVSSDTKLTGYRSADDIQAGDFVSVTFGAPKNPGDPASALSIQLQGRQGAGPGQPGPGPTPAPGPSPTPGPTPTPGPRLTGPFDLAQTSQPGPGAPQQFAFTGQVLAFNRQTRVLQMQGLFLQAPPSATLVDETGRQIKLEDIQQRILAGQVVALRVEAEQRGGGLLQILKAGVVDVKDLYAGGEIQGPQTGPLTLKAATFQATPQAIPLANAVNVPTDATLTVEFNRKISSGALNNATVIFFPKPDDVKVSVQNGNLVIVLKLKTNTAYTAAIDLDGQEQPIFSLFTTGASLPTGAISGKVKLPTVKDIPLPSNAPADLLTGLKFGTGESFVFLMTQDPTKLVNPNEEQLLAATVGAIQMQVNATTNEGTFKISAVPPGKYYLVTNIRLRLVQQNGSPPLANVQSFLQGINLEFFAPYSKTAGGAADQIDVAAAEVSGIDIQLAFPTPISVAEVTPKDGSVSVPLATTVSVRFSAEPARQGNAIGVNLQIIPAPLSGQIPPGSLKLDGNTVSAPVQLQANTAYQLVVLQANGQGRPPMKEPFKSAFTTGATLGKNSVSGKLLPPPNSTIDFDRQVVNGFVGLIPSNVDLGRLTPADLQRFSVASDLPKGSRYSIRNAPAGSFFLVAVVNLAQGGPVTTPGNSGTPGPGPTPTPAPTPGPTPARLTGDGGTIITDLAQTSPGAQPGPAPGLAMGFLDKDKDGKPDILQLKDGDPPLENLDIQTQTGAQASGGIKQAPRELTVTATSPKNEETSVKLQTELSVTFSEALAPGQRFIPVDVALHPAPDKFDPKKGLKVKDEGRTVVLPVTLAQNTTYKFVVLNAQGATGAQLAKPFEITFSTGAVQVKSGNVSGKVTTSDRSTPVGDVKLIDAAETTGAAAKKVEVRASADITSTGDYLIPAVLPNRPFTAYAEVDLGEAGVVQVFYDKNGDGKPDILTLKEGEDLKGIDFVLKVPEKVVGPPPKGLNKDVKVSVDADPTKGNQGLTTVAGLGTNARVDVAVYVKGVKDLTGFVVTAEIDTDQVAFDGADPETAKEGTNLLNASGGQSLFLPPQLFYYEGEEHIDVIEYAGALLSPTSATAPDGDGLAVVFHFVTTRNFTSEATVKITQLVLKGINSQGQAVTDSIPSDVKVTLVPLTATTTQILVLPTEVEGKVGVEIVGKDGKSLGRNLEQVAAGDSITVNILAREGANGITGFTARLEFNPDQVGYVEKSFTAGTLMPGLTALAKSGTGFVEVGGAAIAAFGGKASTSASGVLGTVRFVVQPNYSGGTFIALTNASYQMGTFQEAFDLYTLIFLGKIQVPQPPPDGGGTETLTPKAGDGTGMLDLDVAAGDQSSRTLNGVKAGQKVDVQVLLNRELANAAGFRVILKFDPTKVSVVGWKKDGTAFGSAIDLPAQAKGDSVDYGASILGGSTTAKKEAVAVLTFQTASDYTGDTEITLSSLGIRVSGAFNTTKPGASVVLSSSAGSGEPKKPTPDFDGDGEVGFNDFFAFASAFGQPGTGANKAFDLDGDGEVGFNDFFAFAGAFGTKVSKKPALAKPAGLGAAGVNGDARLGLHVLPSDRQDVVTVDLKVAGAQGLKGYGVDLMYDPAELEFIDSKPEGTFETGGEARPLLRVSDGLGQVHLGDVLSSEVVSGEGTLNRLSFRVRPGGGIGSLRLSDGLLLDVGGLTNRVSGVGLDGSRLSPLSYGLGQNYPNPFNPVTQVSYQVPEAGRVRLVVYNILGQRIRTLVDGRVEAGFYRMNWDGRDDVGRSVSSGLYLYRMEAGKFSQVHKMMLLK